MGYMLDFVVDHVQQHVDLDGSHFSKSMLELVLCACFTTECGNPGIRKSMFTSFSFVCSLIKLSWSTTGLTVLSRSVLSPKLNVSLSWQERVWQPSVRSCAISTLRLLQSSDERVWVRLENISNHSNSQIHFAIPVSCQSRSNWICKNVTRFSMCVPNAWRPVSAARHSYGTA